MSFQLVVFFQSDRVSVLRDPRRAGACVEQDHDQDVGVPVLSRTLHCESEAKARSCVPLPVHCRDVLLCLKRTHASRFPIVVNPLLDLKRVQLRMP